MKPRKQIIEEILEMSRKHLPAKQEAILHYTLMGIQDALLYNLADELGLRILTDEALKEVLS